MTAFVKNGKDELQYIFVDLIQAADNIYGDYAEEWGYLTDIDYEILDYVNAGNEINSTDAYGYYDYLMGLADRCGGAGTLVWWIANAVVANDASGLALDSD